MCSGYTASPLLEGTDGRSRDEQRCGIGGLEEADCEGDNTLAVCPPGLLGCE